MEASGVDRALLARDCYTYLHLPLVAGTVESQAIADLPILGTIVDGEARFDRR